MNCLKHTLDAKAVASALVLVFLVSSVIPTIQGSLLNGAKQPILPGGRGFFYACLTRETSIKTDLSPMIPVTTAGKGINISINGTMGCNGWYVSPVIITIIPDVINHTYYKLHAADNWTEYTGAPITVTTDGIYELYVYYMDTDGQYHTAGPYPFKIDRIPPTVILIVLRLDHGWLFNVTCYENMSGLWGRVEFYVDNVLVANVTMPPYGFMYGGKGKQAQAMTCDNAGNVGWSNIVQDLGLSVSTQPMITQQMCLSTRQLNLQQR